MKYLPDWFVKFALENMAEIALAIVACMMIVCGLVMWVFYYHLKQILSGKNRCFELLANIRRNIMLPSTSGPKWGHILLEKNAVKLEIPTDYSLLAQLFVDDKVVDEEEYLGLPDSPKNVELRVAKGNNYKLILWNKSCDNAEILKVTFET